MLTNNILAQGWQKDFLYPNIYPMVITSTTDNGCVTAFIKMTNNESRISLLFYKPNGSAHEVATNIISTDVIKIVYLTSKNAYLLIYRYNDEQQYCLIDEFGNILNSFTLNNVPSQVYYFAHNNIRIIEKNNVVKYCFVRNISIPVTDSTYIDSVYVYTGNLFDSIGLQSHRIIKFITNFNSSNRQIQIVNGDFWIDCSPYIGTGLNGTNEYKINIIKLTDSSYMNFTGNLNLKSPFALDANYAFITQQGKILLKGFLYDSITESYLNNSHVRYLYVFDSTLNLEDTIPDFPDLSDYSHDGGASSGPIFIDTRNPDEVLAISNFAYEQQNVVFKKIISKTVLSIRKTMRQNINLNDDSRKHQNITFYEQTYNSMTPFIYLICNQSGPDISNPVVLLKLDSSGLTTGLINGYVFGDLNSDCVFTDSTENGFNAFNIVASDGINRYYTSSNQNGYYELHVPGNNSYSIISTIYPYWNYGNCSLNNVITLDSNVSALNLDLALNPSYICPLNTVNISTSPPFRIGRPQTYYVNYCNKGTITSPNAFLTIKLDSLLDFNSSSIPYSVLPDNTYRFDIGNLDFLACGNFSFVATPKIGAVQLNQTLCIEAHIYPDTVCTTPNFTGSYIVASAQCLGDSVELKLENRGGDMQQIKHYIVIEDQVMRINHTYQLPHNGSLTEKMQADSGHTYRIIAEQEDNFPSQYGDKFATAAIEGCRPNPAHNFSTGYFTQFPNYDGEPFRSLSCNVITGSYDPNEKVASPTGYATPHYIEKNTQIDYQINFQNTGNDTAFKVVVVDTISPALDINSIQLGVASYPYQFQRTDSNVVQFVFDHILLVDSFRNEPKSHGFVKFKIQQKLNNPNGTKIYNKADIYFDYNAPVSTNQTYHTVGQNFVQVNLISGIKNQKYEVENIEIMPNPFHDKAQIVLKAKSLNNPLLLLYSLGGQLIKTIPSSSNTSFDIYREDLAQGMYIFKIVQGNEEIANGKLIVQ